jgi:uncharacterized protein
MESRFLQGPAGRLDSRWHGPANGPPALLLHPHPLFGGTMGSRLVYDLAVALASAGYRAVRFNFRGVERSEGTYGEGAGELEDAVAVFDAVTQETGQLPVVVGYSFGAAVACDLASRRSPAATILVAIPTVLPQSVLNPLATAPQARGPVSIIMGDQDEFVSVAQGQQLASRFQPPASLTVLPGGHHFLEPSQNPRVTAAVLSALARLPTPATGK